MVKTLNSEKGRIYVANEYPMFPKNHNDHQSKTEDFESNYLKERAKSVCFDEKNVQILYFFSTLL